VSPAIRASHSRAAVGVAAVLVASVLAACGGGGAKAPAPSVIPGVPLAQAGADGHAAARVALSYAVADARGRGAHTCELVTSQLRSALDEQHGGCAKALSHPPVALAETSVSRIAVTGSSAIAVLPDPGQQPRQIVLVKQRRRWRVSNGGT
jgi:hypothetical protein